MQSNLKCRLCLLSLILGNTSQVLITLSFLAFSQRCIIFGFLRFLYSELSGIRSKTWNLVVAFFYWRANSGFSLSLCNCYVFFIHFAFFFYTPGSLVEGQISVRRIFNSRSLHGTLSSNRVPIIHFTFFYTLGSQKTQSFGGKLLIDSCPALSSVSRWSTLKGKPCQFMYIFI